MAVVMMPEFRAVHAGLGRLLEKTWCGLSVSRGPHQMVVATVGAGDRDQVTCSECLAKLAEYYLSLTEIDEETFHDRIRRSVASAGMGFVGQPLGGNADAVAKAVIASIKNDHPALKDVACEVDYSDGKINIQTQVALGEPLSFVTVDLDLGDG
jgi:hypothetical protein